MSTTSSYLAVHQCRTLLVVAGLLTLSACSSLDLHLPGRTRPMMKADKDHPVIEAICLWQAGEGQGLDELPTRGFAGQILFFAQGRTEPVLVDGDVTIYVFDDIGGLEEQSKPFHEFKFDSANWQRYRVETHLGVGHQIFIPYTRPGAHHAKCSIKLKYTPKEGRTVYSRMAQVVLPGTKTNTPVATQAPELKQVPQSVSNDQHEPKGEVVQASHELVNRAAERSNSEIVARNAPQLSAADTSRLERLIQQATNDEAETEPAASEAKGTAPRTFRLHSAKEPESENPFRTLQAE